MMRPLWFGITAAMLVLVLPDVYAQDKPSGDAPSAPVVQDDGDADEPTAGDEADSDMIGSTKPKSQLPKLSSFLPRSNALAETWFSSSLKSSAISSAHAFSAAVLAVRPFVMDPMRLVRLPTRVKAFVALFITSIWCLLQALTGFFTIFTNPASAVKTFCLGTFCFHASFIALRRDAQLKRLFSTERMPFTMTTGVTMLAAAWNALEGKRAASLVFGALHLTAFTLDACSHIPYGDKIFRWLMTGYLALFRGFLGLFGIKIEPPSWMRATLGLGGPTDAEREAEAKSQSAGGKVNSWLASWIPSSIGTSSVERPAKQVSAETPRVPKTLPFRTQVIYVPLGGCRAMCHPGQMAPCACASPTKRPEGGHMPRVRSAVCATRMRMQPSKPLCGR